MLPSGLGPGGSCFRRGSLTFALLTGMVTLSSPAVHTNTIQETWPTPGRGLLVRNKREHVLTMSMTSLTLVSPFAADISDKSFLDRKER